MWSIIPVWTFGDLSEGQSFSLLDAVKNGMGIIAWHGAASAFLGNREYKHMLGGQFVDHPGGDTVAYTVTFLDHDSSSQGLESLDIVSEQYYLLVDPSVNVIATTSIIADDKPWLSHGNLAVRWLCYSWCARFRNYQSDVSSSS